jgi:hypothetical protein
MKTPCDPDAEASLVAAALAAPPEDALAALAAVPAAAYTDEVWRHVAQAARALLAAAVALEPAAVRQEVVRVWPEAPADLSVRLGACLVSGALPANLAWYRDRVLAVHRRRQAYLRCYEAQEALSEGDGTEALARLRETLEEPAAAPTAINETEALALERAQRYPLGFGLEAACLNVLFGPQGSGKSTTAAALVASHVLGCDLDGERCDEGGRALWVSNEEDPRDAAERLLKIARGWGRDALPVGSVLFPAPKRCQPHCLAEQQQAWARLAKDHGAGVVVFDSWSGLCGIPENDNAQQTGALCRLSLLFEPAAVLVIHHSRKSAYTNRGDRIDQGADAIRGASAILGVAEVVVEAVGTPPRLEFRRHKGRWGESGTQQTYLVEYAHDAISVRNLDAPAVAAATGSIRDAILGVLPDVAGLRTRDLYARVKGYLPCSSAEVTSARDDLERDGLVVKRGQYYCRPEATTVEEAQVAAAVEVMRAYVTAHPGCTATVVRAAVRGTRRSTLLTAFARLTAPDGPVSVVVHGREKVCHVVPVVPTVPAVPGTALPAPGTGSRNTVPG